MSLRRFIAALGFVSGRYNVGPLSIPINKQASPGEICEADLPKYIRLAACTPLMFPPNGAKFK